MKYSFRTACFFWTGVFGPANDDAGTRISRITPSNAQHLISGQNKPFDVFMSGEYPFALAIYQCQFEQKDRSTSAARQRIAPERHARATASCINFRLAREAVASISRR